MKKILLTISIAIASYSSSLAQWSAPATDIHNTNTGNVGIGTTNPGQKLNVEGATFLPGSLTLANISSSSPFAVTQSTTHYGLYAGTDASSGSAWMQVANAGTAYSLLLNPLGGNVGIGTTNPGQKLNVEGATFLPGSLTLANISSSSPFAVTQSTTHYGLYAGTDASSGSAWMQVANAGTAYSLLLNPLGGNVGIGTASPDEKLTVNGIIHSTEVKVTTSVPTPDYVFKPEYKLTDLNDVKSYVDKNHHLPEIPSAKQIEKEGISLGDMNMKLLKKVEELTLYLIEQKDDSDRQNKLQQQQINQLKLQLDKLTESIK